MRYEAFVVRTRACLGSVSRTPSRPRGDQTSTKNRIEFDERTGERATDTGRARANARDQDASVDFFCGQSIDVTSSHSFANRARNHRLLPFGAPAPSCAPSAPSALSSSFSSGQNPSTTRPTVSSARANPVRAAQKSPGSSGAE